IPYLPIIDVFRRSLGLLETDPADVIAAKVQTGLQALGIDPEASAPYLLRLLSSTEGQEAVGGLSSEVLKAIKARTMDVLREMAIAASRDRAIIFAVEDLQWIDQTSEDALASLAESLAGCPIIVINKSRTGNRPPWLGRSYASQIGLDRLTPADSLEVVRSVVREQLTPAPAETVIARGETER